MHRIKLWVLSKLTVVAVKTPIPFISIQILVGLYYLAVFLIKDPAYLYGGERPANSPILYSSMNIYVHTNLIQDEVCSLKLDKFYAFPKSTPIK